MKYPTQQEIDEDIMNYLTNEMHLKDIVQVGTTAKGRYKQYEYTGVDSSSGIKRVIQTKTSLGGTTHYFDRTNDPIYQNSQKMKER